MFVCSRVIFAFKTSGDVPLLHPYRQHIQEKFALPRFYPQTLFSFSFTFESIRI